MLALFSAAIFVSAFLLFMVQPMAAKGILPLLGGSPAVWNTCMVFFQALLLAGYAYAHGLSRLKNRRTQIIIHLVIILAAAAMLPIAVPSGWSPPSEGGENMWLLKLLAVMVGAPFFLLATTGPLVQSWFSATGHKSSSDPYFLYAASNAGSFLGLLGYPLLVEPLLGLRVQGWVWSAGFGVLAPLLIACGVVAARRSASLADPARLVAPIQSQESLTWRRRLWWIFLSFVPSSLVIGTTQYLSTDIAAVPLLWVVPLSIYLLTFIIAFSKHDLLPARSLAKILPFVVVAIAVASLLRARHPVSVLIAMHVITLFLGATLCHKRLADDRPHVSRLTEFYLWISVGGVLGGIFNALIAPLAFNDVVEYPLAIGLACLARYGLTSRQSSGQIPWKYVWTAGAIAVIGSVMLSQAMPGVVGTGLILSVVGALLVGAVLQVIERMSSRQSGTETTRRRAAVVVDVLIAAGVVVLAWYGTAIVERIASGPGAATQYRFWLDMARIGLPCLLCFLTVRHALRFGLAATGLLVAALYITDDGSRVLHQERTFFGVMRVIENRQKTLHVIRHGTTTHGLQLMPEDFRRMPTVYYHHDGPFGDIMYVYKDTPIVQRMAVIGMGAGGIAAYGRPGHTIDFYEIDPAMERIARNPDWFTYLKDSEAQVNVIIGDGRREIARVQDGHYGVIVVDAFSSDSIPLHLITKEAVELYLQKLMPGGVLMFHISNRHIHLDPPLVGIGGSLGLTVLLCRDEHSENLMTRPWSSHWVAMGRTEEDLAPVMEPGEDRRLWLMGFPTERTPVWTDDHANVISQFKGLQGLR